MTLAPSVIHSPANRTRMRRRSGSANSTRSGSGSATRKRPTAPLPSGPCCQERPMIVVLSFLWVGSGHAMSAFLQGPGVAVRVGEVGEAGVVAALRIDALAPSAGPGLDRVLVPISLTAT